MSERAFQKAKKKKEEKMSRALNVAGKIIVIIFWLGAAYGGLNVVMGMWRNAVGLENMPETAREAGHIFLGWESAWEARMRELQRYYWDKEKGGQLCCEPVDIIGGILTSIPPIPPQPSRPPKPETLSEILDAFMASRTPNREGVTHIKELMSAAGREEQLVSMAERHLREYSIECPLPLAGGLHRLRETALFASELPRSTVDRRQALRNAAKKVMEGCCQRMAMWALGERRCQKLLPLLPDLPFHCPLEWRMFSGGSENPFATCQKLRLKAILAVSLRSGVVEKEVEVGKYQDEVVLTIDAELGKPFHVVVYLPPWANPAMVRASPHTRSLSKLDGEEVRGLTPHVIDYEGRASHGAWTLKIELPQVLISRDKIPVRVGVFEIP